jgi:phosphoribosyl-ATP pyrophosphohydrolase/phosphoribosyl-AMP cyclohydrolase
VTRDAWLDQVRFGADGLVPVVAQDHRNGNVLMLAWATREALEKTASSGQAHYWSRSRKALWRKGETSGHSQQVEEIRLDCDGDTVLYRVNQQGPACHTGQPTCFSTVVQKDGSVAAESEIGGHLLSRLANTIAKRAAEKPAGSYTVKLLERGVPKVSQKVGEEAVELVIAANVEAPQRVASESADLLYHLLVLLEARGVPLDDVLRELAEREK